ncbi:hypothetical protein WKH21_05835 [Pantoea agglomerans]|uniref:hypothetical protein n=1 Tax=Enterobacter agglomerans TaxID=549 RepID=UPI003C7A8DD8
MNSRSSGKLTSAAGLTFTSPKPVRVPQLPSHTVFIFMMHPEAMNRLNDDLKPFLITSDGDVFPQVRDKAVYLTINGEIFAFHNLPGIRINEEPYSVPVFLTASPL